jgi:hypothetical protein
MQAGAVEGMESPTDLAVLMAKPIKAFFDEKYEVPQMRLRTTIYKHEV